MTFKMQFASLAISALALSACGSPYYTADPIEAWVVDAEAGKPIEGAVVTANWQLVAASLDTGGRKLRQLEVMETTTDKNGRFSFPAFTRINWSLDELREQDPLIRIFKSGFQYSGTNSEYPITKSSPGPSRHSKAAGMVFRLKGADLDANKAAHQLSFLASELAAIVNSGNGSQIARMLAALACESKRLNKIDSKAGFSVPGTYGMELRCDND